MSENNPLIEFETEYPKLYEVLVNGVPVYAALRDGVNVAVNGSSDSANTLGSESGKISPKRIIDSAIKLKRFKKSKTLIFTSSVYRRDRGRNLAAEYLMDKYPEAVVFEWPSRNEGFDYAYFNDAQKDRYCPLEWYLIKFKLYMRLHKNEFKRYCDECKEKLKTIFPEDIQHLPENYQKAIEYIRSTMPGSYATTIISQKVFRKLFKSYHNIEYAIDFWGSARENIIPILQGKPQSVELQHGIITKIHPGYIYPKFVKDLNLEFFQRTLLVYGNKTKVLLIQNSVFLPDKVEVIGNPRIMKYNSELLNNHKNKNLILFASQTYEQDGTGKDYYKTIIPILKEIKKKINSDSFWSTFELGVKLHPRENNSVLEMYEKEIPCIRVFDNTSQLYDLLGESFLQITVSSTTLFEAAQFGTPTIQVEYSGITAYKAYGFDVLSIRDRNDIDIIFNKLSDSDKYQEYLDYIIKESNNHQ